MKILFLLDSNIDTLGGAQYSVKTLQRLLSSQKDIQTGLFMPWQKTKDEKCSLSPTCTIFLRRPRGSHSRITQIFLEISALRKAINNFKPNVVHAHSTHIAIILGVLKKLHLIPKNLPIIFTDRGYLPEYSPATIKSLQAVAPKYTKIVTTTKRNLHEWEKITTKDKLIHISNALDQDWFNYHEGSSTKLRKKYHLESSINIGFSGRFEEYKRWDTALEICNILKNNPMVHFICTITADAGIYRKQLKKFVKQMQNDLGDRLLLIQDATRKEMQDFYDLLDIFILTSRNESFGRTLIEAMARKTITLGTNSGGVPEVIGNSKYLFPVGDAEKAVRIVNSIIKYPHVIPTIKEQFYQFALKHYGEKNLLNQHLDLYRELLENH